MKQSRPLRRGALACAAVALGIIVYYAMLQSSAALLSVGEFAAFVAGMLLLTAPLKRVTDINEYLQKGLAASESVFHLIDREPEPDHGTVAMGRARGEVRFEGVGFSYGDAGRHALDGIDLAMAPGETVALVGARAPARDARQPGAALLPATRGVCARRARP